MGEQAGMPGGKREIERGKRDSERERERERGLEETARKWWW